MSPAFTLTRSQVENTALIAVFFVCMLHAVTYITLVDTESFLHQVCPNGTKETATCPCASENGQCLKHITVHEYPLFSLLHAVFMILSVVIGVLCWVSFILRTTPFKNE